MAAVKLGYNSVELNSRMSRMALYSPMSSPDVHTSDINESDDDGSTGYDYEFIPTLDNKYTCPICLLALRDPVQTGCGHRFCHLCILRCIRNQARCPVDQTPLSSKQLFQDRSAHREVLDLKVKCCYKGCDFTSELRNIEKHMETCSFRQVPCRHKCGLFFSLDDLAFHEESECTHRPVLCSVCGQTYPLNSQKEHEEECKQQQPVECPHCNHTMKRYKLNQHISGDCPQAPIQCVFDKVGCLQKHSRHDIQLHMESSTQIHLQYLLGTVIALQKQNDALQESLQAAQSKLNNVNAMKQNLLDSPSATDYSDTITNSVNLYDSEPQILHNGYASGNLDDVDDEIDRIKAYHKRREESDGRVSSSSSATSSPDDLLPSRINGNSECTCGASAALSVLENNHKEHDQKIVSLDHHVRELKAKMENQTTLLKEINSKLSSVEQRMDQQELRCCNGLYYWRIREYTKLRKAATQGDMPVLHSPGFYTSPQGYRMCIRANLDGVENAQGTHLSLFVHIMKGEYDDLLNWPFYGTITLTVINQRELPSQRSHISETLEARSDLMAFQRPTTERNQKGYGYIDFFPLRMIESEGFIKSNTLVIKAQVRVYDS